MWHKTAFIINLGAKEQSAKSFHFKKGAVYMPAVRVKDNEPFDIALRRFKRSCEKAGVLSEIRRREFYEKPTAERKRKAAAAVKRHLKKISREQTMRQRQPRH